MTHFSAFIDLHFAVLKKFAEEINQLQNSLFVFPANFLQKVNERKNRESSTICFLYDPKVMKLCTKFVLDLAFD